MGIGIRELFYEGLAYAGGVLISCGPSQLFGTIKGGLDLYKLHTIQTKIAAIGQEFKNRESTGQAIKRSHYLSKYENKIREIKADLLALIPFVGALLSWRMYAKEQSFSNLPILEYAIPQFVGDGYKIVAARIFYPLSNSPEEPKEKAAGLQVKIPVEDASGVRLLDARYLQNPENPNKKCVVLFHGNAMTCDDIAPWADYYYMKGFDVLMPTMGGYPGSEGVKTTEESSYRDVEAILRYLENQGVTHVGYHGLSIGGTLAFQAATSQTAATKLKTTFVIADQTFTTAVDVAENTVRNNDLAYLAPFARGAARTSCPEMLPVVLDDKGTQTVTDGLDNKRKAALLAQKEIPLLVIGSDEDVLMGKNKKEDGLYETTMGDDLLKARYGTVSEDQRIMLHGPHCSYFGFDPKAIQKLGAFLSKVSPEDKK
jgi:hypothetical protein